MNSDIEAILGNTAPVNINQLLETIFWKKKELVPEAKKLLDHIKEWNRTGNPYTVDEWKRYCAKNSISQSSYHNMLKRLKNAGMVGKRYNSYQKKHELHLTEKFSELMRGKAGLWERYIRE
ncbi:MAG: hypothetical protein B6U72_05000 [Candidatus Altiarchaeales archaeon ex4484_2]|nr:MAG: hypothetical protein B6U72_05000 [Candidatus Altiarchaeales archaeon ex4484_2]